MNKATTTISSPAKQYLNLNHKKTENPRIFHLAYP